RRPARTAGRAAADPAPRSRLRSSGPAGPGLRRSRAAGPGLRRSRAAGSSARIRSPGPASAGRRPGPCRAAGSRTPRRAVIAVRAGLLVFSSVFDPILWHFKVALIAGIVIASPVWLYQLWAFVTPGLQRKERRYSLAFVGAAVPLFLCGATLAYLVMSRGLQLLLN